MLKQKKKSNEQFLFHRFQNHRLSSAQMKHKANEAVLQVEVNQYTGAGTDIFSRSSEGLYYRESRMQLNS